MLPNYITVSGKTRQNDLDVTFLISMQPGGSTNSAASGGGGEEHRQQFLTFGDASWGSIKLGKDLGIFSSDAILSDMTLLGVGSASGNRVGSTTTLGRIGTGYIYADWKNQVAYSSPNFNGFSFTAGVTQAWNQVSVNGGASSDEMGGNSPAFEGKASYAFAGDVAGKVWVSAISQKVEGLSNAVAGSQTISIAGTATAVPGSANSITDTTSRAEAFDIGANVNVAGFGGTAYYFNGKGIGHQAQMFGGFDAAGKKRDSDGYYVQGTYTLPGVGTKLGVSYGESNLDMNTSEAATQGDLKSDMWTVGAYHPLTKHLNLVAEYSKVTDEEAAHGAVAKAKSEQKIISLGAILFF
ncbi:OmpC Outer membrane protein (porin) [Methylophilaceae bacterium]